MQCLSPVNLPSFSTLSVSRIGMFYIVLTFHFALLCWRLVVNREHGAYSVCFYPEFHHPLFLVIN